MTLPIESAARLVVAVLLVLAGCTSDLAIGECNAIESPFRSAKKTGDTVWVTVDTTWVCRK